MARTGIGLAVRRVWVRALTRFGRTASRLLRTTPAGERARRFLLERAWAHLPSDMLDAYLVSGYQNPRINIQSILLRHHLVRRLFGDEFEELMDGEIRFAIELNEVLRLRASELGVTMGSFIDRARYAEVKRVDEAIAGRDGEFADRWAAALADRQTGSLAVLEFACGSANDYRAFVDYGLARFVDYRGVDLTATNIANARRRFPGVKFEVGDVTDLAYPDGTFDCVIASDLFEHLPPDGMAAALDEAGRLTRGTAILTFFNMVDIPEHVVRPKGAYHWNRLSRTRVEEHLRRRFPSLTITPIATWLAEQYDYTHSYNRGAWTIVADSDPATAGGPGAP